LETSRVDVDGSSGRRGQWQQQSVRGMGCMDEKKGPFFFLFLLFLKSISFSSVRLSWKQQVDNISSSSSKDLPDDIDYDSSFVSCHNRPTD
jgi:hypothetical protein